MAYLIHEKPIRTDGMSSYPYSAALESIFSFESKYSGKVSMGVKRGNLFLVPRELAPIADAGNDWRVSFEPSAIDCKKGPRGLEQAKLIAQSVELLKAGVNHVFEAPTGFGKSYCGCAIAAKLGQPTIIVVPKQDLMDSWRETLIDLIGIDPKDIGILQADQCSYKGKRFVLAMVQSLVIENKYPDEVLRSFGLAIFDEGHRMAADQFVKAMQILPALYRLTLSATPDRTDGKWRVVEAHTGRVMVRGTTVPMSPKVLVKKTGWKIPRVKRFKDGGMVMMPIPHAPGRLMPVFKEMAADHGRNHILVDFAVQAYKAGRTIVMMSELIDDHLKVLYQLMRKHVPPEEMDFYIGGRKKVELELAKKARVVFATYAMCSEGTDVPAWDTLVLCLPRANVKQAIGRVMRTMEGKRTPVVFDPVDNAPLLQGYYSKRQRQYFEVGATVQNV